MINTVDKAIIIYELIFKWLSEHTPGERCTLTRLKYYYNNLWRPILSSINTLNAKSNKTEEEIKFLNSIVYHGDIYRLHCCKSKQKGYIYETNYYESWSKDIIGLKAVPIYGDLILIKANTDSEINKNWAIDVIGLLCYIFQKFPCNQIANMLNNPRSLCRYEEENEIVFPMLIENILEIKNVNNLDNWECAGISIPEDKWKLNSL